MKIKVKEEGREDVYIVEDRESLKEWIKEKGFKYIHNFINPTGGMFIGADHDVKSVLKDITAADGVSLTLNGQNIGHELALIMGNEETGFRLEVFDIGKLTKDNLEII